MDACRWAGDREKQGDHGELGFRGTVEGELTSFDDEIPREAVNPTGF